MLKHDYWKHLPESLQITYFERVCTEDEEDLRKKNIKSMFWFVISMTLLSPIFKEFSGVDSLNIGLLGGLVGLGLHIELRDKVIHYKECTKGKHHNKC